MDLGVVLFFIRLVCFRSSYLSVGVFYCCALVPGTLALDLPTLISDVWFFSVSLSVTTEFVSLKDEESGRTLGVLLMSWYKERFNLKTTRGIVTQPLWCMLPQPLWGIVPQPWWGITTQPSGCSRIIKLGWVSWNLFSTRYIKSIPTHEQLFSVGKSDPNATFNLFFLGLGWPWVGEFVGFMIMVICFPTQHNSVHPKHPSASAIMWGMVIQPLWGSASTILWGVVIQPLWGSDSTIVRYSDPNMWGIVTQPLWEPSLKLGALLPCWDTTVSY